MSNDAAIYDDLKARTERGELLWHYTSWEGLEGIIKNNNLWASNIAYLNDTQELWHAFELAQNRFEQELGSLHAVINRRLTERHLGWAFYVISFAKTFDALGQWREYTKSSIGFALGFNKAALQVIADTYGFRLTSCTYDDAEKARIFEKIIEDRRRHTAELKRQEEDPNTPPGQRIAAYLAPGRVGRWEGKEFDKLAVTFKHRSFAYEEEVRIVSDSAWYHKYGRLQRCFRRKGTLLVPYLELPLEVETARKMDPAIVTKDVAHPLEAVLVGPNAEQDLTLRALTEFLGAHHLTEVRIGKSQAPVRWF